MEWSSLFMLMSQLQQVCKICRRSNKVDSRHLKRVQAIYDLRDSPYRGASTPQTLEELVAQFKHQRCKDPRDKVFALLGLASSSATFQADYNDNIEQVYLKVLRNASVGNNERLLASVLESWRDPQSDRSIELN
jgi:hypothetical protein